MQVADTGCAACAANLETTVARNRDIQSRENTRTRSSLLDDRGFVLNDNVAVVAKDVRNVVSTTTKQVNARLCAGSSSATVKHHLVSKCVELGIVTQTRESSGITRSRNTVEHL